MGTMFFSAMEFVLVIDKISKKSLYMHSWRRMMSGVRCDIIIQTISRLKQEKQRLVSFFTQQQGEADC